MQYPKDLKIQVNHVFGEENVTITLNSPITVFVGANGLGKTQTLKAMRDKLRSDIGEEKVRYLSSNRIGLMEMYRSYSDWYFHSPEEFSLGGKEMKQNRHTNETATGDFFTLDEKKDVYIKVAERLSILFKRYIYLRWESGALKVYFGKTESQEEYSVIAEASGLVNIISILSALYDDVVQVLLVDEPEVSLHPQLQSYILHEMQSASKKYNKTVVLSTHSSSMIPFETIGSISNIVFFAEGKLPIQISPSAPELNNRKLQEFIMRMSQIYKDGFFAKRILLIEGASDNIICRFLMQKLNIYADVAGSQIIPIDGKGQFPAVVKLFRLIGKEVFVLTDLDGFTDDNSIVDLFSNLPEATKIANSQGGESVSRLIQGIKTKLAELTCEEKRDGIKEIYESHPYWKKNETEQDASKRIVRSMLAMLFSSDLDTIEKWPESEQWKQLKIRAEVVFNDLEMLGCYILKRGAIESYYNSMPNDVYEEKPTKAVAETSWLKDKEESFIKDKYRDIINALERVSETCEIDEGYAVRKELLSELALAIEVLSKAKDEKDIYAEIKRAKGQSSTLFLYNIICEDNKKGIKVELKSDILNVKGFPFIVYPDNNVNEIVSKNIMHI